jgi:hypothetical protein
MTDDLARARQALLDAQTRMKSYADKDRVEVEFNVNDMVWLNTKNESTTENCKTSQAVA